jgi:predicted Fe-Mo cluster-binding NifX family protein
VPWADLTWSEESILDRIRALKAKGVDCLICGAAEPWAEEKIRDNGLEVVTWVRGSIESILQDLTKGGLEAVQFRARQDRPPALTDPHPSAD